MLEFAQLPRPWPLGDEAAQQKLLRKLKPQHWFPHEDDDERSGDDNSSGETRPKPPDLMELEDPQYFTTDTHCNAWHCRETCDASCEEMAAYDEDSVETAFGLNRIFSVRDREFCGGCPNIEQAPCDCNRDASFVVRRVPTAVVLSAELEYEAGRSLNFKATTMAGQQIGHRRYHAKHLAEHKVPFEDLFALATSWSRKAGLYHSRQQQVKLVLQGQMLRRCHKTFIWTPAAQGDPPRKRLRTKTNLQQLRFQRYMNVIAQMPQPPVGDEIQQLPEDMA